MEIRREDLLKQRVGVYIDSVRYVLVTGTQPSSCGPKVWVESD